MRVGLLAKKIGMTRIFDETGTHQPVTVLECPESVVLSVAKNSKNMIKLASFNIKEKSVNKPQISEFKKLDVPCKKHVVEFKVDDTSEFKSGQTITIDHFVEGQLVDVRGKNIGKGFAGGMKRHGFGGLEATHGVSISHRSHGSTGQCQDPGRVFKGKKMAGQMGNVNITTQNLKIIKIDSSKSLLFIKGAVPGKPGALITVTDAVKKNLSNDVPYPAFFKKSNETKNLSEDNIVADEKNAAEIGKSSKENISESVTKQQEKDK